MTTLFRLFLQTHNSEFFNKLADSVEKLLVTVFSGSRMRPSLKDARDHV